MSEAEESREQGGRHCGQVLEFVFMACSTRHGLVFR